MLHIIKSVADLSAYQMLRKSNPGITAELLAIERAQVLEGDIRNIYKLFDTGFRMMSPAHFSDRKWRAQLTVLRKVV
jgi:membrane dipeptidase